MGWARSALGVEKSSSYVFKSLFISTISSISVLRSVLLSDIAGDVLQNSTYSESLSFVPEPSDDLKSLS